MQRPDKIQPVDALLHKPAKIEKGDASALYVSPPNSPISVPAKGAH